jgi:two-component system response regulator YesN
MGRAGQIAFRNGQPYMYLCHAGLIEVVVPVLHQSEYRGSIIFGRGSLLPINDFFLTFFIEQIKDLDINKGELQRVIKPHQLSIGKLYSSAQILLRQLCYSIDTDYILLRNNKNLMWNANLIEYMLNERYIDKLLRSGEGGDEGKVMTPRILESSSKSRTLLIEKYLLEHEKLLIDAIRNNDRKLTAKTLTWMIGDGIIVNNPQDVITLKAILFEYCLNISQRILPDRQNANIYGLYWEMMQDLDRVDCYESLLAWLIRFINRITDATLTIGTDYHLNAIEQAKDYLEKHFMEKLSIDLICKTLFMSKSQLSHLFKQVTGLTITQYVSELRIKQAKILLSSSNDPIKSIAYMIGYDDNAYFTRCFKKQTGLSPNTYRQWVRNNLGKDYSGMGSR